MDHIDAELLRHPDRWLVIRCTPDGWSARITQSLDEPSVTFFGAISETLDGAIQRLDAMIRIYSPLG